MLAVLSMLVPLLGVVSSGTAQAETATIATQWTPVNAAPGYGNVTTSPAGDVTVACSPSNPGQDLTTYSASGVVTRQISRTSQIDGVNNCIQTAVIGKNGDLYGVPWGPHNFGPNLLSYTGNTLNWKYPVSCGSDSGSQYAVGADGNIYATTYETDGVHLIGLNPTLAAGQTVPTKVLDIKVPNDCTMFLYTYTNGVVLHGQQSGGAQYYSYGGKFLGTTQGDWAYEKINATGQLFSSLSIQGTVNVSAYDPTPNATVWTTPVSTPGASVYFTWLQSLTNGGVVALVWEQKMISAGIPYVPTTSEYHLVTLNASGIKVNDLTLASTDTLGNAWERPTLIPDASGNVAFVRQLDVKTGNSGIPTVPSTQIAFIDTTTGALTGTQMMSGNATPANGPLYGYEVSYAGNNGPVTGTNAVYVIARCYGSCADISTKLYPVTMTGGGLDYPRGSVISPSPRPTATYWALGDSYSSGEGNPPFMAGTDIPGVDTCHRSSFAYPELLSGTSSKIPTLTTAGFRACSGAVTGNIWDYDRWNESFQTDWWPDLTTTLVTITVGGNDIGFSDFGQACFFNDCSIGSSAYNTTLGLINNSLQANLTAAYQNILTMAPNAKVYVIGYPNVIANKSTTDPFIIGCGYMDKPFVSQWQNARGAYSIVSLLDAKILATVAAINNPRLHFVNTTATNSPFNGHTVCDTGNSWFQNVDQAGNNAAYVFHPNQAGQTGLASIAGPVINAG